MCQAGRGGKGAAWGDVVTGERRPEDGRMSRSADGGGGRAGRGAATGRDVLCRCMFLSMVVVSVDRETTGGEGGEEGGKVRSGGDQVTE